jgi:acetylornithine deacetylase
MLENLKDLVSINSYESKNEIIGYLKNKFFKMCEEVLVVDNKENTDKSLIIGVNTKLKNIEPIVLSGHIDTVAPDVKKYNTNPFSLTIKDGKAYGLGSIDMKSFFSIILSNIEKIKNFNCPIVLAITTDEETNLLCVENVIKKFKELNIKPKFTIVGEPTKSEINNVSNGCFEFEIEVKGKSCHSSLVYDGINAINVMARIITFIEEKQKEFDLTSNCGVVVGGDIVNRVPDLCNMKFDIRSTKMESIYRFLKEIINNIELLKKEYKAKIYIKKLLQIPPLQNKNEAIINKIASELNLNISKFVGGCEAGYYQSLSGDAIVFGVGDINLAHKPNEYVKTEEYANYSKILIELINKISQIYYAKK